MSLICWLLNNLLLMLHDGMAQRTHVGVLAGTGRELCKVEGQRTQQAFVLGVTEGHD